MDDAATFQPFGAAHAVTVLVAAVPCVLPPLVLRAHSSPTLQQRVGVALGLACFIIRINSGSFLTSTRLTRPRGAPRARCRKGA